MGTRRQNQASFLLVGALVFSSCSGVIGGSGGAGSEAGEGSMAPNPGQAEGGGGAGSAPQGPGGPGATTVPGVPAASDPTLSLPPVMAPGACQMPAAGPTPLRRLSRTEYINTLRDLFGAAGAPAVTLTPDPVSLGFDNMAASQSVGQLLAEQYETTAAAYAAAGVKMLPALLKCDVAAMGEDACARRFLTDFGLRAFRRPLTMAESTRWFAFYAATKTKHGFAPAIETLLQGILMSPQLLYRSEVGGPAPGAGAVFAKLTPYELATRLSYFLWASLPDEALFAAAAANQLQTPAQVAAQAGRMLADTRAHVAVGRFYEQWLEMDGLENVTKDSKVYSSFKPSYLDFWKRETSTFIDDLVFKGDAKLKTLFSADYTFANKTLADLYRLTGPATDTDFERVMHNGNRLGLLTHGSFLAKHANTDQSSPIKRGVFVRESLFCAAVPPPPSDVEVKPPEVTPGQTTRERFKIHTESVACGGCHKLIDPIGFAFENFDGIGRYRTTDQMRPVDANAELVGTDVDGPFTGALELARRVARSEQVSACVVTNWFRFTHGREETPQDACVLDTLKEQMKATGGDLKRLIVALTQSQLFLNKTGGGL